MKSSQVMSGLKWTTTALSLFTMVFSPVAMGREAERMSRQQVERYIVEFGLHRKETVGQFWDKSKFYAPANLYAGIQKYVNENKNMTMPETTVTLSKTTDGTEVPTLQMYQGGKSYTVQLFGEKERYIRINGVNLTESDLLRLRPAMLRLEASDINIKKEADKIRQNQSLRTGSSANDAVAAEYARDFGRFKGFPRVTPKMWRSMSKNERAGYIVKMRLLWNDAQKVNTLFRAPASTTKPQKSVKDQSLLEKVYGTFVGEEAFAAEPAGRRAPVRRSTIPQVIPVPAAAARVTGSPSAPDAEIVVPVSGTTVTTRQGQRVNIPYNAEKCVVAGYVGAYSTVTNRGSARPTIGCSADIAIATYANATANGAATNPLAYVKEANDRCASTRGARFIACNPIIYGYPNGAEACVDRDTEEFQTATHFQSRPRPDMSCDGLSRLGTTDQTIQFSGADYSSAPARVDQIKAIEADQAAQDYALTKTYLAGVLTKRDSALAQAFAAEPPVWNQALDNELVRIQTQFEAEISSAISACEANITRTNERNQKLACDQLHRRWLFTERFIEKIRTNGCLTGSTYIGQYAVNPTTNRKESSYADSASATTALNKQAVTNEDKLCQCPASSAPPASGDSSGSAPRVALGQSCPAAPPTPVVVTPPPTSGTTVVSPSCPSGNPISDTPGGPVTFCQCPINPAIRVPVGQPLVCQPVGVTCSRPQGIDGFNYETCRCDNGNEPRTKDGRLTCEKKDNTGLIIAGVGLAALAAFLLLRKHNHKDSPQCAAGTTLNAATNTCTCTAVACDLTLNDYNAASCSCTPKTVIPPVTCPNPAQTNVGGVCQCTTAGLCTGTMKIYDYQTCQCTDKPEPPKCENGSLAPDGLISKCPKKCPDGSYVAPTADCPVPSEGGSGNSCPSGDCNGGVPTSR